MTDVTKDGPIHAALSAYRVASQNVRCPICNGIGGCDHTVRERMLADLGPIVPTKAMIKAGGGMSDAPEDLVYDMATIRDFVKREFVEGDKAYQLAIVADEALKKMGR